MSLSKSIRRDPLFFSFLISIAGIVAADLIPSLWLIGCVLLILSLSFFLPRARVILLVVLLFLGAYASLHLRTIHRIAAFPLANALRLAGDEGIEVSGLAWVNSRTDPGEGALRTAGFNLESILVKGHEVKCRHSVPVWIQGRGNVALSYGDSYRFTGLLYRLRGASSPGGFDSGKFFYRSQGALARLVIRPGDSLVLENGAKRGCWIIHWARDARVWMEKALSFQLPSGDKDYLHMIEAMTLGAGENSPADVEDLFRLSGTMHIFAVSGLHVGIVAGLLFGIVRLTGRSARYAVFPIVLIILFYAIVTGLRPSAVRAALMLSIILTGTVLKQKPWILNSLGLSGLIILAFDTQQVFQPGFQLSFAVLVTISLLAGRLRNGLFAPFALDPFLPRKLVSNGRKMLDSGMRHLSGALAISLAAWIGSAVLLAWHFQVVAPVGVLANLVMVPIAGVMVCLAGVSVIFFGAKLAWIAALTNKLNVGLAVILTSLAQFFSHLPMAHVYTNPRPLLAVGDPHSVDRPTLRIDTAGLRGESASLLSFSGGNHWMFDSGSDSTFRWQVLPILRSQGINQLEGVLISHGDQGHIGAIPEVISRFHPKFVIESPLENRARIYSEISSLIKKTHTQRVIVSRGQRLRLSEATELRVLFPDLAVKAGSLADDRSLVLKLHHYDWSVLFTFDSGFATEKILMDRGVDLSADLWIRGQNSGAPSGLEEFVEEVHPLAIISTDASFPQFEKLSPAWKKMISDHGIRLFDLEHGGTVTASFSENEMKMAPFRSREAPWVWKAK